MLCSLDDFAFESGGVNLANIKRQSVYSFEPQKLINAFDEWQTTEKYTQTITLSGVLIKKDNATLHDLERLAEQKKPVTLAFDDGRASSVLILEINTDQSHFLKNGTFLKQDFEVVLGVVNGQI